MQMIISYEKLKLLVRTMAYSKDPEVHPEFLRSSRKASTGLIFGMYSTKNYIISSALKTVPQNYRVKLV